MKDELEEIKVAQTEADDVVSIQVGTDGVRDVIGIEVLSLHGDVTEDTVTDFIDQNTETKTALLEINGQKFAVKTIVAQLNKVNMVDPMDLEAKDAIPIQVKISELLAGAGLNVSLSDEMQEVIDEELESTDSNKEV